MHIHNVYFWLKTGLDDEAVASFEQGLETLIGDPAARGGHYGRPAPTDRDVVDDSYSYGMVLVFEERADHDRYQVGEIHLDFIADHAAKWERVTVYDIETDPTS